MVRAAQHTAPTARKARQWRTVVVVVVKGDFMKPMMMWVGDWSGIDGVTAREPARK